MNFVLLRQSLRDSWVLLISCCVLLTGFICLRVWVTAHIKFEAFIKLFTESLKFFQGLLPVPIEELATPLGRVAFGYEEFPTLVLMGLWTVWRGSECIVGRAGAGTMEMLLAQPIRRVSVVASHTIISLGGVAAISLSGLAGSALGLFISEFEDEPPLSPIIPAAANYLGLGVFILGAATLASIIARTRAQAVGLIVGFYVIELTLMIMGRLTERYAWLEKLTILSAYEPTLLSLGLHRDPATYWPTFWLYNAWLFGLGSLGLVMATLVFCRRDVPAPL